MTSPATPPGPALAAGPCRVVRADRGAVLLVPVGDVGATPVRVALDRDGLVPRADGTRVPPTVGDVVDVAVPDGGVHDGAVHDGGVHDGARDGGADGGGPAPVAVPRVAVLHERRTALVRDSAGRTSVEQVMAANVDVVLVVEHLDPDPDLGRVERLLTLAWRSGATPVVVLTKADLVPDPAGTAADVAAVSPGVDVHAVSVPTGAGLEPLRALLRPGVALVAVGPSGAGKSTLVNALAGREVMATGERRADGRGRHTTTHRELVPLAGGAVLVDTPGIRGVGLVADADALDAAFADVADLAARCRFRDCAHGAEPGCAVQEALATGELDARRFDSWRRLAKEAAWQARRADVRLAAEGRARFRRATRAYHRDVRTRR